MKSVSHDCSLTADPMFVLFLSLSDRMSHNRPRKIFPRAACDSARDGVVSPRLAAAADQLSRRRSVGWESHADHACLLSLLLRQSPRLGSMFLLQTIVMRLMRDRQQEIREIDR